MPGGELAESLSGYFDVGFGRIPFDGIDDFKSERFAEVFQFCGSRGIAAGLPHVSFPHVDVNRRPFPFPELFFECGHQVFLGDLLRDEILLLFFDRFCQFRGELTDQVVEFALNPRFGGRSEDASRFGADDFSDHVLFLSDLQHRPGH